MIRGYIETFDSEIECHHNFFVDDRCEFFSCTKCGATYTIEERIGKHLYHLCRKDNLAIEPDKPLTFTWEIERRPRIY